MNIIDAWIQHPTPRMLRDPMFTTIERWATQSIPEDHPVDFTLAALDGAGISHALVNAWWGPLGPLMSNDEVAAIVAAHPSRFTGVASVDLLHPMAGVRELRRSVRALGLRALRVLPWLYGLPPNDRRYYPLYAECVELNIPFCLQVGQASPYRPSEPGRPIPYLDEVALDFPELTIVASHIGFPWTTEMIALATKYPNVYMDTSACRPSRFPADLVQFLRGPGRRKVMFGSNYPVVLPADCVEEVAGLGLDEEALRLFLSENAARVFGLLA